MGNVTMPEDVIVESYEDICNRDREYVGSMGQMRWILGDDAATIETKYGEHTMQDFARDIGANKSTIAGYCRVSKFYLKNIRRKLLDELPNLTYSHFKDALRLKDLDLATDWLRKCSDNDWSPDKASYELTQELGEKPDKGMTIPGKIESVQEVNGSTAMVYISIGMDDKEALEKLIGSTITIKTKEL